TQNVVSPGRSVAAPLVRLMRSHWGGRIDETETRFCCSMSASRNAYSNAVSAWRCTPTPCVRNTLLGNGNIVPRLLLGNSRAQRCSSRPSFFPCPVPQRACDSGVRRLGGNQADSGQAEPLSAVMACPGHLACAGAARKTWTPATIPYQVQERA